MADSGTQTSDEFLNSDLMSELCSDDEILCTSMVHCQVLIIIIIRNYNSNQTNITSQDKHIN